MHLDTSDWAPKYSVAPPSAAVAGNSRASADKSAHFVAAGKWSGDSAAVDTAAMVG